MKLKITTIVLACLLLLASLAACGKGKDKDPDKTKSDIPVLTPGSSDEAKSPNTPSSTTAATTTAATTTEATTTSAVTDPPSTSTTTEATTTTAPAPTETFTACNDTVYVISYALNLRTSPAVTNDNVYNQVSQGAALKRTGYNTNWCRVEIEGKTYYVSADFVSTENPNAELTFTTCNDTVYVTADFLNIRVSPSSTATIFNSVPKGTELKRTGYDDTWCRVEIGGKSYYVSAKYVTTEKPGSTSQGGTTGGQTGETTTTQQSGQTVTPPTDESGFTVTNDTVYVTVDSLNLLASPEASASVLTSVAKGTALTRTGVRGDWNRILLDGKTYYVTGEHLSDTVPFSEMNFNAAYDTVYVTADFLNARDELGNIADTLERGTQLIRIGYHEDWSRVMYGNKILFCATRYLSAENPLPGAAG